MSLLTYILTLLGLVTSALSLSLPLHTSSRWILDSDNQRVKLRCVNWAGHMETHLPEGLHKQSIDYLASWIAQQGFNCVRLTYSIDYALNPTLKVSDAFAQAAAPAGVSAQSMADLYTQAESKNPFLVNATTQDVYGAVVDTLWSRGVMTVMDNHVSKASWCCNLTDGNGWWKDAFGYNPENSRYFDTANWLAGLNATAAWAQGHEGVVAMSLRNEIRQFLLQGLDGPYDDWYNYITQAATYVHAINPDVLVVVGGMASATDLSTVRTRNLDTTAWSGKHVWEFHAYSFTVTYPNPFNICSVAQTEYGALDGFTLGQGEDATGPLILSEFGVGQLGGPNQGVSDGDYSYLTCLVEYMEGNDAEWALWALQGTYYVRNGQVDYNESYGLLDATWSDWRNAAFPAMLGSMWNVTQYP